MERKTFFAAAMRRAAIVSLLALAALECRAQELWPGTQYGMSPAEVTTRIPSAKPVATAQTPSAHGVCTRRASALLLGGVKFGTCFRFIDGKLANVLARQEDEFVMNQSTKAAFERIAGDFRKKYGEPTSATLELRYSGLFGSATWQGQGTLVELSISPSTQHTSHLVLQFKKAR